MGREHLLRRVRKRIHGLRPPNDLKIAVAKTETPSYKVIQKEKPIEIREYAPTILAEVRVAGERGKAINAGFRLLADYIFGNNVPKKAIAMTAPVGQQRSEKIAMTAPVTQTKNGDVWKVQFTMPSLYTLETLPKPNNPEVKTISKPSCRVVAIKFSGFWSESSLKKHLAQLEAFIHANDLKVVGDPTYAFYNPPWTLPFLRRNEIIYMISTD
jgi:effector-binding domain-containing protein